MCDFVSWIEVRRGLKKHILYLTDKDVFSSHGREVFPPSETRDNDVLGHGAIRKYYGLKSSEGVEHEYRDFWNLHKLPQEIAEKVKNFNVHWGKMFSSSVFQIDDLKYIVKHGPDEWKARA